MTDTSVKNYQSFDSIKLMFEQSFNQSSENIVISKLSGGMKNAVYLIEKDNFKTVLKVAPKDESKMITVDRNIIWWEAQMLKLMNEITFPSPKLFHYDDSCEICESPYMFMSYIDGVDFLSVKKQLTEIEIANIEYELGTLSAKICSIENNDFYLPSHPQKKFDNNYDFVKNLFEALLEDAKLKQLDLGEAIYKKIMDIIESKKESLNNITKICLSHTDIWDGNVLIKNGKVTGIVDFSDLYYCDELLTFYFHTIDGKTSEEFLKGFNNKKLNSDEKARIEIYRMYVILKMIVDCKLKEYGRFDWMYENLNDRINILQKVKKPIGEV